jgi:class 3 adenylate cyclase/tetratricopeptide (TPR) repeat protein
MAAGLQRQRSLSMRLEVAEVICPNCARENSGSNAFCGKCGSRLQRICSNCRERNPLDHEYCGACGQNLFFVPNLTPSRRSSYTPRHLVSTLGHPGALEGERKEVTVLFVDVKGSMELAEGIDAEEWHAILDRFFHILTAGVHRFEGTINQYTGDGIMALFGAPIAHEDHAQRACHAALHLSEQLRHYAGELRRERGLDFVVRMGVNSGDVVVGRIGDDLRMDYTAQGYTVGLAARVLDVAEVGRIYLTDTVAERVRGFFALEDLGDFRLKGVSEPVRVHALCGLGPIRTRFDAASERGLTCFIGRDQEMALLEDRLNRVLRGTGHVIGVVGGPGIGKTRLCREFLGRCAERGVATASGSALPHGKMIPFLPALELLRNILGIEADEPDDQVRAKLGQYLSDHEIPSEGLPLLYEFFEVPEGRAGPRMQFEAGRRQLHRVLSQVLEACAPRVLLVEDLHWLDGGSEALLDLIVDVAQRAQLLVLVNFRREYRGNWMHKAHFERIQLAPLDESSARELVRSLVGKENAREDLTRALVERTSGNPFFIEELVRTLRESGGLQQRLTDIALPSSIQSVIAARIDRLPTRYKTVLHAAAVVGQTFGAELVARMVELPESDLRDALRELIDAGFILERTEAGVAAGFEFRYPLTQEVAYRSQLSERRMRTHRVIAETLETSATHDREAVAATIAHHWENAGDLRRAAQWHARAARAAALKDTAEGARHWLEVRSLLERAARTPEAGALLIEASIQILEFGWAIEVGADQLTAVFRAGRERALELKVTRALASLDRAYAFHSLIDGSMDEAARWFEEAIELQSEDADLVIVLRTWQCMAHIYGGRLSLALPALEQILASLRGDLGRGTAQMESLGGIETLIELSASPRERESSLAVSPSIWARVMLAMGRIYAGEFNEARAVIESLSKLATAHGDRQLVGVTHNIESLFARYVGDFEAAEDHAHAAMKILEAMGSPHEAVFSYLELGAAECLAGQCSRAVENLERAYVLARGRQIPISEAEVLSQLTHAYLGLGETSWALSLARRAVDVAQRRALRLFECDAQLALARALRHVLGIEEISAIEQALEIAEKRARESGARAIEPFVHIERAAFARVLGHTSMRQQELERARDLFAAIGADGHRARMDRLISLE